MADKDKIAETVAITTGIIGLIRAIISLFSKNNGDPNICKEPHKKHDCGCDKSPKTEE